MFKQLLILFISLESVYCVCLDPNEKELSGICFHYVKQKMTFEDAKHWCHYENPVTPSNLAYVPTQFAANFLASYARSAFGVSDGSFWIGLSRAHNWDQWTWDTGLLLDGWSNFDSQHNKNYVAEQISNGKWITLDDSEKHYLACSYDPTNPPTFPPIVPSTLSQSTTARITTTAQPTTTVRTKNAQGLLT
uniref:C-type lectin domain-containing protein n=1 Tax=Caenorhabditis tropicalis TaxID=1561998 RepID=A0A1I7V019_9PELO